MNYSIEGKLEMKTDVIVISDKFKKREFVITKTELVGQKEFVDYIKFEITQNNVSALDSFSVGEGIKVEFNVRGRKWEKDGRVGYFNSLQAWRLTHVEANKTSANEEIPPVEDNDNDPLPF
jgi:hypothetical protein